MGQGRPGEVLRNLLLHVSQDESLWSLLCEHIRTLFDVELLRPEYGGGTPYIVCEYRPRHRARPLDIANAGSGFLQVLLLLAFFYAREGTLLLLDEPDAHLHVILQMEVYDVVRQVASDRGSQLLIATHSEVLLDASSPEQVISFANAPPRRLSRQVDRDRLRESLKRLTTTDLLLAAQIGAVLYVEDRSDEQIRGRSSNDAPYTGRNGPAGAYFELCGRRFRGATQPRRSSTRHGERGGRDDLRTLDRRCRRWLRRSWLRMAANCGRWPMHGGSADPDSGDLGATTR